MRARLFLLALALALGAIAMAQDGPRTPFEALLELGGVTEAQLAMKDRAILMGDEARRPFFAENDPHLCAAVRDALDHPLAISPAARERAHAAHAATGLLAARRALHAYRPMIEPKVVAAAEDPIAALVEAATTAAAEVRGALAALTEEEVAFLRGALPRWVARTTAEARARAQGGTEETGERERMIRAAALCARIDAARLESAFATLVAATERHLPALRALEGPTKPETIATPEGPVLLRGKRDDGGEVDALLCIDFGGDDEYKLPAAPVARPVRLLIDLGGNDLYLSNAPLSWGAALLGLSLLVDTDGDDDYRARDWSLGCGAAGHGALWDLAGNDRYYGGLASQGVGLFGSGLLKDDGGDDEYVAGLFCQGFASTGGLGAILDGGGDDAYLAGRDEEDIWRRIATFITFAQGSAYGFRFGHIEEDAGGGPRRWKMTGQLPGGVGLLFDAEGRDRYEADVFGQGSAYWYSLGLLVDGGGDDRYRATWYGQGVGTHAAAGCVVDEGGDDWYFSRNTSQGCGHDFSVGILHDLAGRDRYRGTILCQGAGNALSGLGILIDEAGDDDYRCGKQAWGFHSREPRNPEAEPYAFFLDLGGSNRYEGPADLARPGMRWKQGERGFGMDRP